MERTKCSLNWQLFITCFFFCFYFIYSEYLSASAIVSVHMAFQKSRFPMTFRKCLISLLTMCHCSSFPLKEIEKFYTERIIFDRVYPTLGEFMNPHLYAASLSACSSFSIQGRVNAWLILLRGAFGKHESLLFRNCIIFFLNIENFI